MEMMCAKCGKEKELSQSLRENGVQQPKFCKDCVLQAMKTDDWSYDDLLWIRQLAQAKDFESMDHLRKEFEIT